MFVDDTLLEYIKITLILVLKIGLPILVGGIIVGLIISIAQSVTQIQEQTLTLVPKIVVMAGIAVVIMPWIAQRLSEFAVYMFSFS